MKRLVRDQYMLVLDELAKKPGMVINNEELAKHDKAGWHYTIDRREFTRDLLSYQGVPLALGFSTGFYEVNIRFPKLEYKRYHFQYSYDYSRNTYPRDETPHDYTTDKHVSASSATNIDDLYAAIVSGHKRYVKAVAAAKKINDKVAADKIKAIESIRKGLAVQRHSGLPLKVVEATPIPA